jgi:hypothetical protein
MVKRFDYITHMVRHKAGPTKGIGNGKILKNSSTI